MVPSRRHTNRERVALERSPDESLRGKLRDVSVNCSKLGKMSTRRGLDVFTSLRAANPNGPRHEIAHYSGIHDDDYSRSGQLNIAAEMSPLMLFPIEYLVAPDGLAKWDFAKMIANNAHKATS